MVTGAEGPQLAFGGAHRFAQDHEASLARQGTADRHVLARVPGFVEAAGLLEGGAGAEDEAAGRDAGAPERRNARLASAASARACGEVAPVKSTPAPPPTAPPSSARNAACRTGASMRVSASTNTSSGWVVARAPALRVAAMCRCSTRNTRAPWSPAMHAVASVEASSTTSSSYAMSSAVAVRCSASSVAPIRRASSCAGMTKETGGCACRPRLPATLAVAASRFNRSPRLPARAWRWRRSGAGAWRLRASGQRREVGVGVASIR